MTTATDNVTQDDIRALIESRIEPAEPAEGLYQVLKRHHGEKLTRRILPELQRVEPSAYLRKIAGMTYIAWQPKDKDCIGSMLVYYSEGAEPIDAGYVREKNPAYFSARVERNEHRAAAVKNVKAQRELAAAIKDYHRAKATIERLTEYGAPFSADSCRIESTYNLTDRYNR